MERVWKRYREKQKRERYIDREGRWHVDKKIKRDIEDGVRQEQIERKTDG